MAKGYSIRAIAKEDIDVKFVDGVAYFSNGDTIPKGADFEIAYWQKGNETADKIIEKLDFEKDGNYNIVLEKRRIVDILRVLSKEDDKYLEKMFGDLLWAKMKYGRGLMELEWRYE